MNVLIAEDEDIARRRLVSKVKEALGEVDIYDFSNAADAFKQAKLTIFDIAFLDIELGNVTGMELAKQIKEVQPTCNIVFCTGYDEYMGEAFGVAASDYLMKPITTEKILRALENLRFPLTLRIPDDKLYVRCFGTFEVYWKGEPLLTLKNKVKELFAFLVDRQGAICSPAEITEYLWEDCSDVNFRKRSKELVAIFEEIGIPHVLIKEWGKIGIAKDSILCDYYEYLKGNPSAVKMYNGEYMSQYLWAYEKQEQLNELIK